jgi:surface polysaccharide O-acyltransferase-like enzyme
MLFIVLSHACGHGGLDKASAPLTLNKFFLQWGSLGSMSVNIFVLISGYFMCEKEFKLVSVSRLLAQTWFYSIALFLVCRFGFGYSYSMSQLVTVFLPTIFCEYWFLSAYIILLLLSPFLNQLLAALSRKQHLQLITTTLFLWVVIRTFTTSEMMGGATPHFVTIYIIGAYFRKCPQNWFSVKRHRIMVTAGSFALLFLSSVAVSLVAIKVPALAEKVNFFYSRNSLLAVSCAVGLLNIFLYCKPFYSKQINTIAGCTFGVYLIHENPVVRTLLWKKLLYVAPYIDSLTLIPRILLNVVIVFCVCILIEFLRQKTIDKPLANCVDAAFRRIIGFAHTCAQRILKH